MCDTLVATKTASGDGVAVFGKNSDRQPNEGQNLAYFPAGTYAAGSKVKCTYIEIPQVEKTFAVLLSKPYWMWGGEMGVNERGVAIGNEAVFSKIPGNKKPALLGMDMLRLALERAATARAALQVIIDLLEEFGQGGNCVAEGSVYYHNSFIIADANDAWVLETVGQEWGARQIQNAYSISNCLTLGSKIDISSPALVELALQKGFTQSASRFDLAKDYADFFYTTFGMGHHRRNTTASAMEKNVSVETMLNILRRHDSGETNPQHGFFNVDVCMHAGFGPVRISQTTASLVAYLDGDAPIVFATGTSAPCTSIFKPIWVDAPLPDLGPEATSQYDPASLYWRHEQLHRATLLNYPERINIYANDRDTLERKFVQGAMNLKGAPAKERSEFTAACFREAAEAEAEWLQRVEKIPARKKFTHALAWNKFNRKANMPAIY